MRLEKILSAPLAFFLLAIAVTVPAHADLSVGVVDTRRLATESKIGKSALERIRAMGESLQRDIKTQQATYQAAVDSFRNRSLSLAPEKRREEQERLQKQGIELKRAAEDARLEIEREGKKIEEEVQKAVLKGLQEFARENDYDVVLDHLQCLFNSESTDITEQVLRYLDANSGSR